jgi:alpha-1,6-mannosyltransferase
VFNYVDVARLMGRYHLDPYTSPPLAERHDSLYVFLHWRHAVTVYGPLFTLPSRLLGRLPAVDAVWAFKAAAAAAAVGCSALVGWIARQRRVPTGRAVAAFGLNPVLLVWTVGGAHNDLLMLLLLLAGTALVLAARPVAGGALAVAAAAIKLSGGLAVPFLVLGAGRGRRLRTLVGAVGAVAVIAALTAAAFPDHAAGMITQLQRQQALVGLASVPLSLAYALGLPTVTPTELHVLHALLAVWLAGCVVAVLRGGDVLSIVGWAFLGVIVASTFMLPWYAVWPLAFAAAAGNWRLLVATCLVAACWIVGHIPVM